MNFEGRKAINMLDDFGKEFYEELVWNELKRYLEPLYTVVPVNEYIGQAIAK